MPNHAAELLKQAPALPAKDRAALADSLLDSLNQTVDEDAEQAWLIEIQKRPQRISITGPSK